MNETRTAGTALTVPYSTSAEAAKLANAAHSDNLSLKPKRGKVKLTSRKVALTLNVSTLPKELLESIRFRFEVFPDTDVIGDSIRPKLPVELQPFARTVVGCAIRAELTRRAA